MPTYEYVCGACGSEWEVFHGIKAPPAKVCPVCDARRVSRKIGTGAAVMFLGPGWQTNARLDYQKQFVVGSKGQSREK